MVHYHDAGRLSVSVFIGLQIIEREYIVMSLSRRGLSQTTMLFSHCYIRSASAPSGLRRQFLQCNAGEMKLTGRCVTQGQGGVDLSPLSSVSPQGLRHFVTFSSETEGVAGLETRRTAELETGRLEKGRTAGLEPGRAVNGTLS